MLRTFIKPVYLGLRELVLRALIRPGPRPRIPSTIRSILVIADQRLGDLCLTLPTLQCLRDAFPETELALVLPPSLQPLAQWACHPNALFDWTRKSEILAQGWDMVIDLTTDYHLKPAQLAHATGAPVRIGFEAFGRGPYFNVPLATSPADHMEQMYARSLAPFGIPFRRFRLPRLISAEPLQAGSEIRVVVHPGAHHQTQRWPADSYAALIRMINGGGERCLVVGGEPERKLVETIVNMAGIGAEPGIARDVLQLAATLQASEAVICNNSGPLHLASMLGIPTLSFMGPTVKQRWAPLGEHNVLLRRNDLPCIGCNSATCRIKTYACMREITPDDAFSGYLRLRMAFLEGLR